MINLKNYLITYLLKYTYRCMYYAFKIYVNRRILLGYKHAFCKICMTTFKVNNYNN